MRRQHRSASSAIQTRGGRATRTRRSAIEKCEFSGLVDVKKGGDVWNGTRRCAASYGTHKDTEIRATCTGAATSTCTGNEHAMGEPDFYPGAVVGPGAGVKIPGRVRTGIANSGLAACPFTGIDDPCIEDGGYVKLAGSLGGLHVRPAVGRSLARA